MIPLLTLLILLLALFGGLSAFENPVVAAVFGLGSLVTVGLVWAGKKPAVWPAVWPVLLAGAVSAAINQTGYDRLWLYAVAAAALWLSAGWVTSANLSWSIALAGLVWPALWLWLKPGDNVNILSVWPVVFALAGLELWQSGRWPRWSAAYTFFHILFLVLGLGSRGAIIGLVGGVASMVPRRVGAKTALVMGTIAVLILVGLILWRPATARNRLFYWQQASNQLSLAGVGPGAINANHLIMEWDYHHPMPHAHNTIFSVAVEQGFLGLLALAYSVWRVRWLRLSIEPWQLATVTALVCHSLVDEPLFWPGPMLLAALVAGSIKRVSV